MKISGATVHFVIPETDAGPILMQGAVGVSDHDTAETLSERILEVEHRIYPDALRLLGAGSGQARRRYLQDARQRRLRQFPDLAGGERRRFVGVKNKTPAIAGGDITTRAPALS